MVVLKHKIEKRAWALFLQLEKKTRMVIKMRYGFTCPLPEVERDFQDARILIPRCKEAKCFYVDSECESDLLPAGCVLLVAALLTSAKDKEEKGEEA